MTYTVYLGFVNEHESLSTISSYLLGDTIVLTLLEAARVGYMAMISLLSTELVTENVTKLSWGNREELLK